MPVDQSPSHQRHKSNSTLCQYEVVKELKVVRRLDRRQSCKSHSSNCVYFFRRINLTNSPQDIIAIVAGSGTSGIESKCPVTTMSLLMGPE